MGYMLNKQSDAKISHLFYMDDLKLYAPNPEKLQSQLEVVKSFSSAIKMEMGLEKCSVMHVKKGVVNHELSTY